VKSARSVFGLTWAVIYLTYACSANAAQTTAHKAWLRPESSGRVAATGSSSVGAALAKSLALMAVLGGAGYFFWRRSRKVTDMIPVKHSHIRVLSGTPIGPKARAVVAEFGGRLILLGVTEHSVRRLAWLDSAIDEAPEHTLDASTLPAGDAFRATSARTKARTVTAKTTATSRPHASTFSEVLRDAVGMKPKQIDDPALVLAESTHDRLNLQTSNKQASGESEYMNVEGQAAGLIARLNRRT
jgi:flagellar biogenesis protein FliO